MKKNKIQLLINHLNVEMVSIAEDLFLNNIKIFCNLKLHFLALLLFKNLGCKTINILQNT